MTTTQVQQCPFCPEFLPEEEEKWNKVDPGGVLAGIAACDDCRLFAGYSPDPEYITLVVERIRAREQEAQA